MIDFFFFFGDKFLQLIDIILIVLTSIAIFILAAMFLSYFGYKARKKLEMRYKSKENIKAENFRETTEDHSDSKNSTNSTQKKQQEKFVVFNPRLTKISKQESEETRKHFPHKLFIQK